MFGLLLVEDDEELALRRALDVMPGENEIPLVLHDQRSAAPDRYAPSSSDLIHGWYGDASLVNFTARPYLDVEPRRYRFRVLNASNARIYRLGVRGDRGDALPFTLIGTDGGLLEQPRTITEVFLSPAERVDLLVDFAGIAIGGFALLESRAFDPMHGELGSTRSTRRDRSGSRPFAWRRPRHEGSADARPPFPLGERQSRRTLERK
jgi:suppressor of ftsI/bilirubin oxidase